MVTYCQLVTSEDHERHECVATKGASISAYGTDSDIISDGKFNHFALVDYIIGNWVEYEIDQ